MSVRNGVGHRGQDVMYRKTLPTAPKLPWSSRWYEMFPNTPCLAAQGGLVLRVGRLKTGWEVILEHGQEVGTGYHHLSEAWKGIEKGVEVPPGHVLGIIGFSPAGYQLAHLHFDVAHQGKFLDAARFMESWQYLTLEQAWGSHGRVGLHT